MNTRLFVLSTVTVLSTLTARAQGVMTLTGAPFSATWTVTTNKAGITTTTKMVSARSSNGSTYSATFKDDILVFIVIQDVPQERQIEIQPSLKQYRLAAPRPEGKWMTRTIAQQHAILERDNTAYTRQALDQKKDATPLGVKIVDGMTIYGHHFVRTRDDVRTMEGDSWQSDWGFTYSSRTDSLKQNETETSTLTEMKRGEPDASLFAVPSGYTLVTR